MIERAVQLLRAGELIGLPTETVYGLAADATSVTAVSKIFTLKGRPTTNPLIVHIASIESARQFAADWPIDAQRLAEHFWPGPLTIIVRRNDRIADAVAAGGSTVGLRVPDHPLALQLLHAFGGAVAAPSANRSNQISPTIAQHVRDEFGDAAPFILDGGPCRVGIESTVVDCTGDRPRVLRPGVITCEMIDAVTFSSHHAAASEMGGKILRSPGQLPVHYAPRTPAYRFEPAQRFTLDLANAAVIDLPLDPQAYARNFYARLRLLDTQSLRAIYIELPPDRPEWRAVRDRVLRATKPYPP